MSRFEDFSKQIADWITMDVPDAGTKVLELLKREHPISGGENNVWLYGGFSLSAKNRWREALLVHWEHYLAVLSSEVKSGQRQHKGSVLVMISDCFNGIGFPIHAKRYLMLALCEDAIMHNGDVPNTVGTHFRLLSSGLTDISFKQYGRALFHVSEQLKSSERFPETLLQRLDDDDWLTEFPSASEILFFRVNPFYVRQLIDGLGEKSGKKLEHLAQYLMSCMPGCRTRRRQKSGTTEYDVVCAMEGLDLDFRSEFGRHFVCECKDWDAPADFSTMAKFARILDATKSRFGILFSKEGVTGAGKMQFAELEQHMFFQSTGKVVVVIGLPDLRWVADGGNFIALLRNQYEKVRLDLRA
jgi:hypothetical protein